MNYTNMWPWPTGPYTNWPFPLQRLLEKTDSITEQANREGIRFMHLQGDNVSCTVAYRPLSKNSNSHVLELAVTYKHKNDQYNRKLGAELAAQRFLNGNTIIMPIRGRDSVETMRNISSIFLYSVEDMRYD